MMLTEENEKWLHAVYPGLEPTAIGVAGVLKFRATYNKQVRRFLVLGNDVIDTVGGLALSGEFSIGIEERNDKTISALPALHVEGIDPITDRHLSQQDKSACLCSPFEEGEFLHPGFRLKEFLQQLVIPFFYGQVFYSDNQRWPWQEYAHGATGLLESYSETVDQSKAEDCLQRLARYSVAWPSIRATLRQKPHVKGHTPCFCEDKDLIRRCHPRALLGALKLQQDVRAQAIPIP